MTLHEVREAFRADMAEHDYCIGQERVEAVFRKLLGEPEPVHEPSVAIGLPVTWLYERQKLDS